MRMDQRNNTLERTLTTEIHKRFGADCEFATSCLKEYQEKFLEGFRTGRGILRDEVSPQRYEEYREQQRLAAYGAESLAGLFHNDVVLNAAQQKWVNMALVESGKADAPRAVMLLNIAAYLNTCDRVGLPQFG